MIKPLKRLQLFLAAGLGLAAVAAVGTLPAASAPSYDGVWSVVIITNSGSCDRAYRYPIRISNGAVLNEGASPATINGKVGNNGAVTVSVSGGGKTAQGSGRLHGNLGTGSWRGGDCAGVWQAEKRS